MNLKMCNGIIYYLINLRKKKGFFSLLAALVLMPHLVILNVSAQEQGNNVSFEIIGFKVEGNSLLTEEMMLDVLTPFTGESKTALDVEKARDALESFYHDIGYPAVLVNIPEQTVENGLVMLKVIESRIKDVKVTGNKYFTKESIMKRLPSLRPGNVIYMPRLQQEFGLANRNSDMKISPLLIPGKELGTLNIELKVDDKLPLHGSLEFNNRSTHTTTDLRLNGSIRYDNLWQKEHSFSLQYQTSPEDLHEVQLLAESYVFPVPWSRDSLIALYAVWADSDTAFGEGFEVIGKGQIFGFRYIMPLPSLDAFSHNLTMGIDYKDFDEDVNFSESESDNLKTPIKYMPLIFSYSATRSDETGDTQFSLGLNLSIRKLVTDQREFEIKRYRARGNYLYVTAGVERTQRLPYGLNLYAKLDGQIASQPLISNEQYVAGGMESVRGYQESELSGDHALHGSLELMFPELPGLLGIPDKLAGTPYVFYDIAELWTRNPLPGEEKYRGLRGAGIGVRGKILENLEFGIDGSKALKATDYVRKGHYHFYFRIRYKF